MKSVEAITLKLRIDPDMADRLNMSRFITRGSMQRKPCWTVSDNIAMIDTVVRQWKCAPIYIIQDIEKKVDEVFDGAHRCEAIFDCINDNAKNNGGIIPVIVSVIIVKSEISFQLDGNI